MGLDLTIVASEATIAELHRTLLRQKFNKWVSYELRMELFARYLNSVILVSPTTRVAECRDPKDDKFLELALDGKAEVLVTGDSDLLCMHPWRGIEILSPADYLVRQT
jgi:putative PIN family toxin of toxin-antitoxin system